MINSLIDLIRNDKEILTAEDANQAREWANKIRENVKGTKEENFVTISAENCRVVISLKDEGKAMKKVRATCGNRLIDLRAKFQK
jgi:hypothetical protein